MTSHLPEQYPVFSPALPDEVLTAGKYEIRFARTERELDEILRLRYQVFNQELGEGLEESKLTGRDDDGLDWRFHHLMIRERCTQTVVGTYRMQTAEMAQELGGFYSAGEFDLQIMPPDLIARSVEIGRACVEKAHRNGLVLHLLWRGLATYLSWNDKTLLFGCCSLTSQDQALGVATHRYLQQQGYMHPSVVVPPVDGLQCSSVPGDQLPEAHIPALFQSYLNLGAKVCGPPAIDRMFKTIDFLVLLDVGGLESRVLRSFFR